MADNLVKAKNAKNDEFYTQFSDIQREVNAYLEYNPDVFRDKTILLPCDDPEGVYSRYAFGKPLCGCFGIGLLL